MPHIFRKYTEAVLHLCRRDSTRRDRSSGMTKTQVFFSVILKQVIKRIVPPMSNEVITLVKDTSLARVVAVVELVRAADDIVAGYAIIWPLFYVGAFYLLFSGVLTVLFGKLEKKLDYYKG